jgi:uncharacterized membrane protein
MEFLLRALRKNYRRIQFENLILLLIRILIMILLAFAIARPYFQQAIALGPDATDVHYVFVIDNSFSMGFREAQFSNLGIAKKLARKILKDIKLSQADRVSLILMSQFPEVRITSSNNKRLIRETIDGIEISSFGTDAFATAKEILKIVEQSKNTNKIVYIFTDMQKAGFKIKDVKKFGEVLRNLSQQAIIYIYDIGPKDYTNLAIAGFRTAEGPIFAGEDTKIYVDVFCYASDPQQQSMQATVSLFINGELKERKPYTFMPNVLTSVEFEYKFNYPGLQRLEARLDYDNLEADNKRYLVVDVKDSFRILCVDGDPGTGGSTSEVYTLRTALELYMGGGVLTTVVREAGMFMGEELEGYDAVVFANVPRFVSPDVIEAIKQYVREGGGVLFCLGDKVDIDYYNQYLFEQGTGMLPAKLTKVIGGKERIFRFTNPALQHPVFKFFARSKDHQNALFYMFVNKFIGTQKAKDSDVLLCYDFIQEGQKNLAEALLERRYEDGKVFLFTSAIDGEWSFGILPTRPAYVPFLHEIIRYLSARPITKTNLIVGDFFQVTLPYKQFQEKFRLIMPGERYATIIPRLPKPLKEQTAPKNFILFYPYEKEKDEKEKKTKGCEYVGIYVVEKPEHEEQEPPVCIFAVNVQPRDTKPSSLEEAESNLKKISIAQLKKDFPDFKFELMGQTGKTAGEVKLKQPISEFWRYLLFALIGFLFVETILAYVFGLRKD